MHDTFCRTSFLNPVLSNFVTNEFYDMSRFILYPCIYHSPQGIMLTLQLILAARIVNVLSTTAYDFTRNQAPNRRAYLMGNGPTDLSNRWRDMDPEVDGIFPLDEDLERLVTIWGQRQSLLPGRMMTLLDRTGEWSDSESDIDDTVQRISYISDPESVEGNGSRGLSPTLKKTMESWDFGTDHWPKETAKQHYSTLDSTRGVLDRNDLYRLRQLQAPPSQQTMARSLPTSSEHGLLTRIHNSIRPTTREDDTLDGHTSPRRVGASSFRGYTSDGES